MVERQLVRCVDETDARVGERDVAEARANHVLTKAHHQGGVPVCIEGCSMPRHGVPEGGQVTQPDGLNQLQVWLHRCTSGGGPKNRSVRDFTQKQLDNCAKLESRKLEPNGLGIGLWRLALRLQKATVCLGVLKLERLDPPIVVQESRELRVGCGLRKVRFSQKFVCLHEELGRLVRAEQQVQKRCLACDVVVEAGSALCSQEARADPLYLARLLVGPAGVEVGTLSKLVECATVPCADPLEHRICKRQRLVHLATVNQVEQHKDFKQQLHLREEGPLLGLPLGELWLSGLWFRRGRRKYREQSLPQRVRSAE
mmetsp:Transcript_634/g.2181  ORF Transcript_634/g.2181 Transcript_634/m.2181 type:complete len:313 (-) Transcript_634:243-1181(-)